MSAEPAFTATLPARPYPGLRPFIETEWPIYFGRERMTDAVVAQLIEKQVLVVHGDSGSGKSSLARAAVLPRLEQEGTRSGTGWRHCTAVPREAPLWNLAEALAKIRGETPDESRIIDLRRALNFGRDTPEAVSTLLRCDAANPVCVLIDQFEELFAHARRHGTADARLLTQFLVELFNSRQPGLYVLMTMRSEFLGACARYPGFAELVNAAQYLLPRMTTPDLRRAICDPAGLFGGRVSFDLAERLILDAAGGQDQLPLIQHGLMLMHREHAGSASVWQLGIENYKHEGGLVGLLSDHADDVMRKCGAPPDVVEALLRALTEINADQQAIRRPQTLAQLVAVSGSDEATVSSAIEAFRVDGVSFLTTYDTAALSAGTLIDISHEALIRCWHRLADPKDGWLSHEFRDGLIWRALLLQAESFERDPSDLMGEAAVEQRAPWLKKHTPAWSERYGGGWTRVAELLAASQHRIELQKAEQLSAREERERSERRAARLKVMVAMLVLAVALGGIAFLQAQRAGTEARRAATEAQIARDALIASTQQFQVAMAARENSEALQRQNKLSAAALASVIGELDGAVGSSNKESDLKQRLVSASAAIKQQVNSLDTAAAGSDPDAASPTDTYTRFPRVYIQIADANQRMQAAELGRVLESSAPGQIALKVPGVELVRYPSSRSYLRCFRSAECASDAPHVLNRINSVLRQPQVTLQDQSARYENSPGMRARHYELWLAAGPIVLKTN